MTVPTFGTLTALCLMLLIANVQRNVDKTAIWRTVFERHKSNFDVYKRHRGRWNQHHSLCPARYVRLGVSVKTDSVSFVRVSRLCTVESIFVCKFFDTSIVPYRDCNRIIMTRLSVTHKRIRLLLTRVTQNSVTRLFHVWIRVYPLFLLYLFSDHFRKLSMAKWVTGLQTWRQIIDLDTWQLTVTVSYLILRWGTSAWYLDEKMYDFLAQ